MKSFTSEVMQFRLRNFQYTTIHIATLFFCIFAISGQTYCLAADQAEEQSSSQFQASLSNEEQEWLANHSQILVSNEFDWPPFDFVVSGTPQGFGIDLMNILAKRSGLTFKYVNGYTWDELVEMFFNGEIDLLHSLSITPEREKNAFFSPPYYHSKNVFILRRDTTETNDLKQLEGKIVALPKGWSSIEFFHKYFPKVHIIEVESSRQALEYVDQGKVFATVEQEGIAAYFMKKFGFHDLKLSKWIENEELQKTSSMHFAILKTNPVLFSILEKAQNTLQPADMNQLEQKWFGREGRRIGDEDVGLTPAEREFLKQKKTISYCIAPERMPLEAHQKGYLTGMSSNFMEIFAERLGVKFSITPTGSWTESLQKIKTGECDFLPMVSQTPERKEFIDFTSSYLSYGIAIITKEQEGFLGGLQDLSGKQVAVVDGSFAGEFVPAQNPDITLTRYKDATQCLLQLSSGVVDAALVSLPVATYHIRHLGLNNLKVAGYSGIQDNIRIGVRKNDPHLHSIMSKLVRALPTKDIESVYQKWSTLTFDHRFDYSLMWKILAAIGLLLFFILIWNWQLMRFNRRIATANEALEAKSSELELISVTDVLTNLFNRRYVEKKLDEELKRHKRYNRELSVILLDIDNFKRVNDTFGHQAGDHVLQIFGAFLQTGTRASDVVGRWGGEEFLIICPENGIDGATAQAEQLRKGLQQVDFGDPGSQSASFGVACYLAGETKDDLVRRADDALYLAKNNGRNRVEKHQA